MRDFTDEAGGRWEVILGRESWGAFYALFVPKGEATSGPGIRKTILKETSQVHATRALMDASESRMEELFQASEPENEQS